MNTAALLNVQGVSVHYDKGEALSGVSLEVAGGEVVALIGPNGAGKTTLLRAVSGMKRITAGEIRFAGTRIDALRSKDIVRLGLVQVPEGKRLFPYMTVLHNLEMGAYTRKDGAEVRHDLEEIFRYFPVLQRRKEQLAATLSGGEQQMLAIGRGLMARPRLLLLDEPSLGLSPLLVTEIGKILREIHGGGVTLLLVEQNAELALGLASRVYVMSTGRIVTHGKIEELSATEFIRKAYLGV